MEEVDKQGKHIERISELNNIFEELLGDGRDFAKDLVSSIGQYFLAGILSILFGLQTRWYKSLHNRRRLHTIATCRNANFCRHASDCKRF